MFDLDRDHFRKPPTDAMAFDPSAEPLDDYAIHIARVARYRTIAERNAFGRPLLFDEETREEMQLIATEQSFDDLAMLRNCRCVVVEDRLALSITQRRS